MTPSVIERHGQSVIGGLILVVMIWVGSSITDLAKTMMVVLNRLDTLEAKISTMDSRFDRYVTQDQLESVIEVQRLRQRIISDKLDRAEKGKGD